MIDRTKLIRAVLSKDTQRLRELTIYTKSSGLLVTVAGKTFTSDAGGSVFELTEGELEILVEGGGLVWFTSSEEMMTKIFSV